MATVIHDRVEAARQGRNATVVARASSHDYPAAHSMDVEWFAVDGAGHVAVFDASEDGAVPREYLDLVGEDVRFEDVVLELLRAPQAPPWLRFDASDLCTAADHCAYSYETGEPCEPDLAYAYGTLLWLRAPEIAAELPGVVVLPAGRDALAYAPDAEGLDLGRRLADGDVLKAWVHTRLEPWRFGFYTYGHDYGELDGHGYHRARTPADPIDLATVGLHPARPLAQAVELTEARFASDTSVDPRRSHRCALYAEDDVGPEEAGAATVDHLLLAVVRTSGEDELPAELHLGGPAPRWPQITVVEVARICLELATRAAPAADRGELDAVLELVRSFAAAPFTWESLRALPVWPADRKRRRLVAALDRARRQVPAAPPFDRLASLAAAVVHGACYQAPERAISLVMATAEIGRSRDSGFSVAELVTRLDATLLAAECADAARHRAKVTEPALERVIWRGTDTKDNEVVAWIARLHDGDYALLAELGGEWVWLTGDRDHVLASVPEASFADAAERVSR